MKRRKFLAVVGMLGIAGCATDDTETIDTTVPDTTATDATVDSTPTMTAVETDTYTATRSPPQPSGTVSTETTQMETTTPTPTDTPTPTPTDTPTPTPTPSGEPDVKIGNNELITEEGEFTTEKFVKASVTNQGDAPSGQITLTVDWYDADGNYLDNSNGYLDTLGAGETWAARVEKLTDVESVADYEINGEFETEPPRPPANVELTNTDLQVGDAPTVTGEAINNTGDELGYLEAIAKVYDDNGVVLGAEYTNTTDIPAGEIWAFSIEWFVFDRTDQVVDYEVLLNDSAF